MKWIELAQIVSSLVKTMIHHGVQYKIKEFIGLIKDCEQMNIDILPWETLVTRQFCLHQYTTAVN